MIGLGVGIDYALLIVTRYREQLHAGPRRCASRSRIAIDTAGRSVLFAGTTVVISLLGMLLMGVSFVQGLAVGAAVGRGRHRARLAHPAARAARLRRRAGRAHPLAGPHRRRPRRRRAGRRRPQDRRRSPLGLPLAVDRADRRLLRPRRSSGRCPAARPSRSRETTAYRWSRVIQHRPWPAAIVGAARAAACWPCPCSACASGFSDESNYAEDTTTKQAYDLLVDGLRPGFNGPLLLVAELPDGHRRRPASTPSPTAVGRRPRRRVRRRRPGPTTPTNPTAVLWNVVPTTGPQDEATTELVDRLRDDVLPAGRGSRPASRSTSPARSPSTSTSPTTSASRLPYFFGAVLALSFLLLMVVFRSLLVPLKAVIMNLLSIGAAYGIVVALFQWGWLSDITGVQPAPIEPWIADDAVRHRLRPVDGLRGVPAVPDPGGVAPHRRQPHVGGRRPGRHGQGHHRGRRDHGGRLRQLPARGRPGASS